MIVWYAVMGPYAENESGREPKQTAIVKEARRNEQLEWLPKRRCTENVSPGFSDGSSRVNGYEDSCGVVRSLLYSDDSARVSSRIVVKSLTLEAR